MNSGISSGKILCVSVWNGIFLIWEIIYKVIFIGGVRMLIIRLRIVIILKWIGLIFIVEVIGIKNGISSNSKVNDLINVFKKRSNKLINRSSMSGLLLIVKK